MNTEIRRQFIIVSIDTAFTGPFVNISKIQRICFEYEVDLKKFKQLADLNTMALTETENYSSEAVDALKTSLTHFILYENSANKMPTNTPPQPAWVSGLLVLSLIFTVAAVAVVLILES